MHNVIFTDQVFRSSTREGMCTGSKTPDSRDTNHKIKEAFLMRKLVLYKIFLIVLIHRNCQI